MIKNLNIKKIIELYNKHSSYEISKMFNCSNVTILNILKKNNIKIRNNREAQLLFGHKGEKNPNFKHGRTCYPNYCMDCGKLIDKQGRSKRCPKCEQSKNPKRKGIKHSKRSKDLIGIKSKEKFTKEYLENIKIKHEGLKKRSIGGYTLIKSYEHPNRNSHNDVFEHRLVMENHLGRYLKKEEVIHHIDENRTNNNIENLYLCKNISNHQKVHSSFYKLMPILLKLKIIIFKNGEYMLNKKGDLGSQRKEIE